MTFSCHMASQSSSVSSSKPAWTAIPTLLTRQSIGPSAASARAITSAGPPGRARSAATPSAAPDSAEAVSTRRSSRPETTTLAPSSARSRAVSNPIPAVEPVTTQTRSWRPRCTAPKPTGARGYLGPGYDRAERADPLVAVLVLGDDPELVGLGRHPGREEDRLESERRVLGDRVPGAARVLDPLLEAPECKPRAPGVADGEHDVVIERRRWARRLRERDKRCAEIVNGAGAVRSAVEAAPAACPPALEEGEDPPPVA